MFLLMGVYFEHFDVVFDFFKVEVIFVYALESQNNYDHVGFCNFCNNKEKKKYYLR